MSGLDIDIAEHKLPCRTKFLSIKNKLRRTRKNILLKIREEVKRNFDTGFLAMEKYLQWVAYNEKKHRK